MNRFLLMSCILVLSCLSSTAIGQTYDAVYRLMADDGEENDRFGDSVDISNGLLVFGAPGDHANGEDSGSAYIFDAETGLQIFKLLPTDGAAGDKFGSSVSIDNGLVVVGAWADDEGAGAAYIFDALTGVQIHKLTAKNRELGSYFGRSVSIDDGLVGIGADFADSDASVDSGAAYVFDAKTGVQLQRITLLSGLELEQFGISVDMDQGLIAVGAPSGRGMTRCTGSAYIFDALTGSFVKKLFARDGEEADGFGFSVSLDNGFAVVGAISADSDNVPYSGAAYIFNASTGEQLFRLDHPNLYSGDSFGHSVAIDQGLVVVGRPRATAYWQVHTFGTAYVYDLATGEQIAELKPSASQFSVGFFGRSVAVEDGVYVVGAPSFQPQEVSNIGAAFVLNSTFCLTDLYQDGVLNFFDVSAFFTAFLTQDPVADFTGEGDFNFSDVSAFVMAFSDGCP